MSESRERLQIGEFAELVGLSIPQLRRYDRLRLLEPTGRTAAGYRFYARGQTGAARVIALLRSIDMPIADVRRIVAGADEAERHQMFRDQLLTEQRSAARSRHVAGVTTGRASKHASTKLAASSMRSTP